MERTHLEVVGSVGASFCLELSVLSELTTEVLAFWGSLGSAFVRLIDEALDLAYYDVRTKAIQSASLV